MIGKPSIDNLVGKFLFPIIKTKPVPDPYKGERCVYEPGICMRQGCGEPRWNEPPMDSVLCRDHTQEVLRGEAKAPPLRPVLDYVSTARRSWLVEQFPDLPVKDDPEAS